MINEQELFKREEPIAPLKIIAMDNCRKLMTAADQYIVQKRKNFWSENINDKHIAASGYDQDTYLVKAVCPRFGSGEAKGVIQETVRGADLFVVSDVTNNDMSFSINGLTHYMSPDDHFADLKRIVAAASTSAERITVILPYLYASRQHKREYRESLDCAVALQELKNMGVANIIAFDTHDPRVMNAIPMHDFDNYSPIYQMMKALEKTFNGFPVDKDTLLVIAPDSGAMSRAVFLANNIGVDMGMFYKRKDYSSAEKKVVANEYLGPDAEGKTILILDDIISTGSNLLSAAEALRKMNCGKIIMCCTFGLFNQGLKRFDEAYEAGLFDYIVTTNLIHQNEELFSRPWYIEADVSTYVAKIINTMNHDVAVTNVITPNERLRNFMERNKA